jgi:hypothetical protein
LRRILNDAVKEQQTKIVSLTERVIHLKTALEIAPTVKGFKKSFKQIDLNDSGDKETGKE